MSRFDRQVQRREKRDPYRMIGHLLTQQVPTVMEQRGLEAVGGQLRQIEPPTTEPAAYLAVQAMAAIAITHCALAHRALELMDDTQRATLLASAPALDEILEALTDA